MNNVIVDFAFFVFNLSRVTSIFIVTGLGFGPIFLLSGF